jgi:spore maturation protein CgeB
MQAIFSDEEVVYFSDMGDLKEKLLYYAAHPEEAALIAEAGHKRAHKDYESSVVTKQILAALDS